MKQLYNLGKMYSMYSKHLAFLITITVFFIGNKSILAQEAFTIKKCNTKQDVVEIIEKVFLKEIGKQGLITNIKVQGNWQCFGSFTNGGYIGFDEGIMMTTGKADDFVGPNQAASKGGGMKGKGDLDLSKMAGDLNTFDACIIEFDFVPTADSIQFTYVFASEEYNQFVDSKYNDVFGFLISGPGITGPFSKNSMNIALVPGSTDYISINNVNCGKKGNYKEAPTGPGKNCEYYRYNDQFSGEEAKKAFEFNGFTVPLVAKAKVTPCKEYHLKLAIADVNDGSYGSGVFLKSGSFDIEKYKVNFLVSKPNFDKHAIEGCNNPILKVKFKKPVEEPFTLPLSYIGNTDDEDFEYLPNVLTIEKGDTEINQEFITIKDDLAEDDEWLKISYPSNLCDGASDVTDSVLIRNYEPLTVKPLSNYKFECGKTIKIKPNILKGTTPFSYFYNDIQGDEQHNITINNDEEIKITVQDVCKVEHTQTIKVAMIKPNVFCGPDLKVCPDDFITINANSTGSLNWKQDGLSMGKDGESTVDIVIDDNTDIIASTTDGCGNTAADTVKIQVIRSTVDMEAEKNVCPLSTTLLTAPQGNSYLWSTGEITQSIEVSPEADTKYTVAVTNSCGNTGDGSTMVKLKPKGIADAGPDVTLCYGETLSVYGKGGSNAEWYNSKGKLITNQRSLQVIPMMDTYYVLKTYGTCLGIDTVFVDLIELPPVKINTLEELICPKEPISLAASGANAYEWTSTPTDITLYNQITKEVVTVVPTDNTKYIVKGTDNKTGCINSDTVDIYLKELLTSTFKINADTLCQHDNCIITFTGTTPKSDNSMRWQLGGGKKVDNAHNSFTLTFDTPGDKKISLQVAENGCQSEQTTKDIYIEAKPVLQLTVSDTLFCTGKVINVKASGHNYDKCNANWETNGGDAAIDKFNPFNISWEKGGKKKILVHARSKYCSSKAYEDVRVVDYPIVDYFIDKTEQCAPAVFNIEYDGDVDMKDLDFKWSLNGMSTFGNLPYTQVQLPVIGSYDLKLLVGREKLCYDSIEKKSVLNVYDSPISDFDFNNQEGCSPLSYSFINKTIENHPLEYQWLVNDIVVDNTKDLEYIFNREGTHSVGLISISDKGCSDTLYADNIIKIFPSPESGIRCNYVKIAMNDPSVKFSPSKVEDGWSYKWVLPVNDTIESIHARKRFSEEGDIEVDLITTNKFGCKSITTKMFEVFKAKVFIPNAFTPNGDGLNDRLNFMLWGIKEFEAYIFDRWGREVHSFTNDDIDTYGWWDGKVNGHDVAKGVYIIKINYILQNNEPGEYRGIVNLLR
ncbi:MAG: choice-of-anchor L domain-containing protein [Hyphomicrobiales bacterium]